MSATSQSPVRMTPFPPSLRSRSSHPPSSWEDGTFVSPNFDSRPIKREIFEPSKPQSAAGTHHFRTDSNSSCSTRLETTTFKAADDFGIRTPVSCASSPSSSISATSTTGTSGANLKHSANTKSDTPDVLSIKSPSLPAMSSDTIAVREWARSSQEISVREYLQEISCTYPASHIQKPHSVQFHHHHQNHHPNSHDDYADCNSRSFNWPSVFIISGKKSTHAHKHHHIRRDCNNQHLATQCNQDDAYVSFPLLEEEVAVRAT